jgi:hypothetical protein
VSGHALGIALGGDVTVTDAQVRKLMTELSKGVGIGVASMRADMDEKTARKYAVAKALPSELKEPRWWRTRDNPFVEDWPALVAILEEAPELEAKTLFEHLQSMKPGKYDDGQLRTLQRHVRRWRAERGPEKPVFFAQDHRPGERFQTDFTWATELDVTIAGEAFAHMLCHVVLPYSNWEHATVCQSESMAALRRGMQSAVFSLGRVAKFHQTDNSTAATHGLRTGKRGFNDDYLALVHHLGMEPTTTEVGAKEQNGDVEASHAVLKRRLNQHLLMRGSRDFENVAAYEAFIFERVDGANALRAERIKQELKAMKVLAASRLPEFTEERPLVTSWSTIRVKKNTYSVPSRLIGERVRVRVFDERLEVFYADKQQLVVERLLGSNGHRINYRHIIWSLVKKPGAFARYRYREDLFPTMTFRRAYDALADKRDERAADIAYLRILHLAASTMESQVEAALQCLLDAGAAIDVDAVRVRVVGAEKPAIPDMPAPEIDLDSFDRLIGGGA